MEEAPKAPIQELATKFELLSEARAEKAFPGLKDEFNKLLKYRSEGIDDEQHFWEQVQELFRIHDVTEGKLNDILQDR